MQKLKVYVYELQIKKYIKIFCLVTGIVLCHFSLKCLFMAFLLKWKNMSLQVSGISTEIFKQIETVENDHDASTAAALEAVERRGEMVVRVIEPRQMGRQASEAAKKFIAMQVFT